VAAEAATKAVAAEASETEAVTVADTKVAAEAATKVAAEAASETEAAIKAAAVADFVTVAATKAAAVAAAFVTVAATKAEQEQDRAIKVRTVAVLRATVAVEVHGPSVKNRPIGLKVAEVKIAQVPSTAVQAIPSVVLQASHA
jgi:hypothetical protein